MLMLNTIDVVQKEVNKIAKRRWVEDSCPPDFMVSEYQSKGEILLTIDHGGFRHTTVLFPNGDYGNMPIEYVMEQLYNSTM